MAFMAHLLTPEQLNALTPEQKKEFVARLTQSTEYGTGDFQKALAWVIQKQLKERAAQIYRELTYGK
jgi:Spy/CpxP family protein refolding chaperone